MPDIDGFEEGAIAMIDILGVKGIWSRERVEDVIRKWESVATDLLEVDRSIGSNRPPPIERHLQFLSDTIIVTYQGPNPHELIAYLSLQLTYPFCHGFLQKIFFRGVISAGKFRRTENLIIGPAIDEAAENYEKHNWIGISLTPITRELMDESFHNNRTTGWYERYSVPLKNGGFEETWVLNWASQMRGVMNFIPDPRDARAAVLDVLSPAPADIGVSSKYDNTIKFFDEMILRHGENNISPPLSP